MTAALLVAELKAVGGGVTLRGDRLLIAAPPGAAPPDLIARLRAAKPALVAYLTGYCAQCGAPEGPSPLLPIGTADDGHTWVHDRCYPAWLADRRSGGRRAA
jgi:hypothetical protein